MTETRFPTGTLYHGDVLDLLPLIPAESVDLIFTDPPYPVISGGQSRAPGYGYASSVLAKNDGKIFEHNDIEISDYIGELFRVLKPSSHCYIMTNKDNLIKFVLAAQQVGFYWHNLLMWKKNTMTPNRWYMKNVEYVLFFGKKPAKKIINIASTQILECNNPRNKLHPTEKPVDLMRHYIENSSLPGDTVLDPFAGCGSTALAALRSGRRWITIEKDDTYHAVALTRLSANYAPELHRSYLDDILELLES